MLPFAWRELACLTPSLSIILCVSMNKLMKEKRAREPSLKFSFKSQFAHFKKELCFSLPPSSSNRSQSQFFLSSYSSSSSFAFEWVKFFPSSQIPNYSFHFAHLFGVVLMLFLAYFAFFIYCCCYCCSK